MEDNDKILTQEEIDSLLLMIPKAKPDTLERGGPTSAGSLVRVTPSQEETPTLLPEPLPAQVAKLDERLNRVEAALSRLGQMEQTMSQIVNALVHGAARVEQVQKLNERVQAVAEGLGDSLGYNARKTFTCSSCGFQGLLAVRIKCTQCGQENWLGWWVKK